MTTTAKDIESKIFLVDENGLEALALEVLKFQYEHNDVYRQFCKNLQINPEAVKRLEHIPFLPIQFFKTKEVVTTAFTAATIFKSSGTSGQINSRHFVKNLELYKDSFKNTFHLFYGGVKDYCVLGLLPSYLERGDSSLVYMVQDFIHSSKYPQSGFYLDEYEKLQQTILQNEAAHIPTLLIGVTYALLDFAEKYPSVLSHTVVMETGGMKGRRQELTRQEVHARLQQHFGQLPIHSEYGMTELLSQAYSKADGLFKTAPWIKVLLRAADDPFEVTSAQSIGATAASGAINIIDLANLYSCAFIATDDVGRLYNDGSFEVLGRLDNSDIRGCGLMIL